jgi:hypothetical protein
VDGEHSPSCQPYQFQKAALQMGSASYVARPLTGFQHLTSFSPYLPPHDLELIENSSFNSKRFKILLLEVEKHNFIFIIAPHVN